MRKGNGLYLAFNTGDDFGVSFTCVYIAEEKNFQISLMLGWLTVAVGYEF